MSFLDVGIDIISTSEDWKIKQYKSEAHFQRESGLLKKKQFLIKPIMFESDLILLKSR